MNIKFKGAIKIVYYIEYLLLENLIIDYLILYITKKITKTKTSFIRLVVASFIGAIYTIITVSSSFKFASSISLKLCISILMIIVAFNPEKLKSFLKLYATFFLINFVFAGAAFSLLFLTKTNVYLIKGSIYIEGLHKLLIISIPIALVVMKLTKIYMSFKLSKETIILETKINVNGFSVSIPALIDTGNSLKDPISEFPVIIAEFDALKKLLPNEVQQVFMKYEENNLELVSELMLKARDIIRFRVIPFKSLGKENGMLLGFKPDSVTIDTIEEKVSDIIVGIYNNSLSTDGQYKALLNPDVINTNKGEVNYE